MGFGEEKEEGTDAGEFDAAVTAFRRGAAFLDVLVSEFSAGGFDDADFVGARIVAEWERYAVSGGVLP